MGSILQKELTQRSSDNTSSTPQAAFDHESDDGAREYSIPDSSMMFSEGALWTRAGSYRTSSSISDQGYQHGLKTAQVFAAYGLSKLGFVEQYISDSVQILGLNSSMENYYHDGFLAGLKSGEDELSAIFA
jgi:hypothetical protein